VVLIDGAELVSELAAAVRRRVREHCSPRHVPDSIEVIPDVPRTLSNKKLEVPVKKILLGADPAGAASRDSLANPAALDWFAERAAELTSR
jgi:acetoacetyl-CoA synthetase